MPKFYQNMKSPIGELFVVADSKSLLAVICKKNWSDYRKVKGEMIKQDSPILRRTRKELTEYFAGKRKKFTIPYRLEGTPFQIKVWRSLAKIPFGKTKTYKEQASLVKSPKAVRAVGSTNGNNPLGIILPCHRVIGSDGSLTGYAGGLKAKKFLLSLERSNS